MVNGPVEGRVGKWASEEEGKAIWKMGAVLYQMGRRGYEQRTHGGGGGAIQNKHFLLKEARLFKYMFSLYSKYSLGPLQISRNCATSCDHLNKETIWN